MGASGGKTVKLAGNTGKGLPSKDEFNAYKKIKDLSVAAEVARKTREQPPGAEAPTESPTRPGIASGMGTAPTRPGIAFGPGTASRTF